MNTTENLVAITGNTYPVKEQLKAIGARWNADAKAWMVTPDKAEQARQIVAGAGPKKPYSGYRGYNPGGFRAAQAAHYRRTGGSDIGFCGARGCGANGCPDCNPM